IRTRFAVGAEIVRPLTDLVAEAAQLVADLGALRPQEKPGRRRTGRRRSCRERTFARHVHHAQVAILVAARGVIVAAAIAPGASATSRHRVLLFWLFRPQSD